MPPPTRCVPLRTHQVPPHQSLPPRGKVARRKPGRMRGAAQSLPPAPKIQRAHPPHQSKIKDFCQLPPRGKPFPSPSEGRFVLLHSFGDISPFLIRLAWRRAAFTRGGFGAVELWGCAAKNARGRRGHAPALRMYVIFLQTIELYRIGCPPELVVHCQGNRLVTDCGGTAHCLLPLYSVSNRVTP